MRDKTLFLGLSRQSGAVSARSDTICMAKGSQAQRFWDPNVVSKSKGKQMMRAKGAFLPENWCKKLKDQKSRKKGHKMQGSGTTYCIEIILANLCKTCVTGTICKQKRSQALRIWHHIMHRNHSGKPLQNPCNRYNFQGKWVTNMQDLGPHNASKSFWQTFAKSV